MSKVEVLHDKQTSDGRLVGTKRAWQVLSEGKVHNVIVLTESCINSRSTWGDRNTAYNRTTYNCECGRSMTMWRRPSKKHLNTHDSWWTAEKREQLARSLEEDVRP